MPRTFSQHIFNRVVSLLLTVIFLSAFPTGASALALCLDEEENHIVDQNLYLDYCHSFAETYLPLSEEHCSALAEKKDSDCVDVSLTNANTLNLPSKVALSNHAKNIHFYTLPSRLIRFQQQVTGQNSSVLFQYQPSLSHLNVHRTTVLLI